MMHAERMPVKETAPGLGASFVVVADGVKKDEAWQAARRSVRALGATDVVTLLGLNQYQTPLQLYANFVNPRAQSAASYPQRMGNAVQSLALELLAEEKGFAVIEETRLFHSRIFPCLMASPDGWAQEAPGETATVECKWTTWRHEEWGDGRLPVDAFAQAQVQMAVTQRPRAFAVGMFPQSGPHVRAFDFAERYVLDEIMPRVEEFLRRVELKDPPLEGSDFAAADTTEALRRLWEPDGSVLRFEQLTPDQKTAVLHADAEAERASTEGKACEEQLEYARNKVRAIMGSASKLILPSGTVWTNPAQSSPVYNVPKDVKALYREERSVRVLRRWPAKGGDA